MKNAIILHGISSNPDEFWFPYVKAELEKREYNVWIPQLPQPDSPDINVYVPWILEKGKIDTDTVLIGHSVGASLILALLDSIDHPIRQAVLVAGSLIWKDPRLKASVKEENMYNWEKMKKNVSNIVFINSTNDPWGSTDIQAKKIFDHLGGLLITNNHGHMGSNDYNQPYKEFPLLVKLVELAE